MNTDNGTNDKKDEGQRRIQQPAGILNACAVVVAALAMLASAIQSYYAREAFQFAGDTANKQLRAYVAATRATIQGKGMVQITIRNSGQTPAQEVKCEVGTWEEKEVKVGASATDQGTRVNEGVPVTLMSGEEVNVSAQVGDANKNKTHLRGQISYKDVFGVSHRTSLHFEFRESAALWLGNNGNYMD
jgi:hypothetical protein